MSSVNRGVAEMEIGTPYVFILSWERPLYLWVCLDSLRRNTRTPCRFVLIDNASRDPQVGEVIRSVEARGFFHRVHRESENRPESLMRVIESHGHGSGGYIAYIESDVVVLPEGGCWLKQFMDAVAADPAYTLLGSRVDKSDFVDPAWAATHYPGLPAERLESLIKGKSPERQLQDSYAEAIIDPFNPPGRLLYVKRAFIEAHGFLQDRLLYQACKQAGHKAGILTRLRHRHLSFQNLFDYPDTDVAQRNAFFKGFETPVRR
jgi:hypothetical protein